jgi:peptidoglycan/LPS O-acetylase OafA/YrhL
MLNFQVESKEYRPELNGLRALAVLLVLLYHLDFYWIQGGFLGVDVFLVISGYFISRNILFDLQHNEFFIKEFYTKRLRRLFPALITTVFLVLIAGYFMLTPFSYERLGLSSLYSAISGSNFFFWSEAGYFDEEVYYKPLLHMWSLSIEEQFYLIWPFLLVFIFKKIKKSIGIVVLIGIVASVLTAEFFYTLDPSAVFFLLPFRMFEFWLGTLCIGLENIKLFNQTRFREVFFSLGLFLIITSSFLFDGQNRMPGLLSLIPCFGTILIIIGGKSKLTSWALKNKSMEYIGKASYSIYLIHWPLIVYFKYQNLNELLLFEKAYIALVSILLGFIMWKSIENTFRNPRQKYKRWDPVWFGVPILILLVGGISLFVKVKDGLPSRFHGNLYMTREEILEIRKSYWQDSNSEDKILNGEHGKGHIIMLGNSHAIDLIYALRLNGFKGKITSLQTGGKCYNFGSAEKVEDVDFCSEKKQLNFSNKNWNKVDAIYMHDDWPKWEEYSFRKIIKEVRELSKAPIYVFGPKIIFKKPIPDIVHQSNSAIPKIINSNAMSYSEIELKKEINSLLRNEFKVNSYYKENNIH